MSNHVSFRYIHMHTRIYTHTLTCMHGGGSGIFCNHKNLKIIVKYKSIIYPFTVIEDHSITETWGIILMWDVVLKILNCYLNKSKILNCMCSMNQFLGETHMKLLPIGCNCGQAQCEWGLWFFTPGQTGPQVACPLLLSHAPLSLLTGFLVWHLHRHRSLLVVCSPSL